MTYLARIILATSLMLAVSCDAQELDRSPDLNTVPVDQRNELTLTGWVVPWCIEVDKQGRFWLNSHYSIHFAPGGTVSEQVFVDRKRGCFRVLKQTEKYSFRDSNWTDMPECKETEDK